MYSVVLTFNFFVDDVQTRVAERHWSIKTTKLNQHVRFLEYLNFKIEVKNVLRW